MGKRVKLDEERHVIMSNGLLSLSSSYSSVKVVYFLPLVSSSTFHITEEGITLFCLDPPKQLTAKKKFG